ncbi:MAG TPA: metallophosphatase family protein, partial [Euryarchaeota archaeon]|nr:metallophosphatase family protein [Euryarchaeota archaeon]
MRIAVISDLHGNMDAVSGMMGSIEDADRIICLGDVVGIGPDPAEVLETVLDDERISWVLG